MSLKKRDIKLYVMCHTAKAYFPDRQSCSTLCRQPSGCARSVEVVAVYPSLGSYSIVGLLRWASLPFKKPFTYMDKMRPFGGVINNSLLNLRFAQKSYSIFAQYNESHINPSTYPHWERKKRTLIRKLFYFCSFAQIHHPVFVQYSVLKNFLHYYPLGSGFCYPILRKNYFLSLIPNERGHF